MRHGFITEYDPKPGVSIATLAYEYPPGFDVPEHAHGSDQLIYATRGVMEVSAGQSYWLLPPQFAIWIPERTSHRIRMPDRSPCVRSTCAGDLRAVCLMCARCFTSPPCSAS